MLERLRQKQVSQRYRYPRRDVAAPRRAREQVLGSFHDAIITALTGFERSERIVDIADAVDADRYGEAILLEEIGVLRGEERRIGRQRKGDVASRRRNLLGGIVRR